MRYRITLDDLLRALWYGNLGKLLAVTILSGAFLFLLFSDPVGTPTTGHSDPNPGIEQVAK